MTEEQESKTSRTPNIEKIAKYVAYASPLLAGVALLKLQIYYIPFGVNILDYVELSEILSFVLVDIFRFVLVVASMFAGIMIAEKGRIRNIKSSLLKHQSEVITTPLNTPLSKSKKIVAQILFALFVLTPPITRIVIYYKRQNTLLEEMIGDVILYLGIMTGMYIILLLVLLFKETNLTAIITGFIMLCLSMYIIRGAIIELGITRKTYPHIGTQIFYEDQSIVTDSTIQYLGKTQNYLLLFNRKDSTVVLLPTGSIKRIDFKGFKRKFIFP